MAKEKEVGKVTHYFNKIGVGIIEVKSPIKVGETLHIKGHTTDFTQEISSMQIEHEQIEKAKKGDAIGMKIDEEVREGDQVFLVIE